MLCNSWSAGTGVLWLFEVLPAPAPVGIYTKRVNTTTVTAQALVDAYAVDFHQSANKTEAGWRWYDQTGYFHPIEGKLAKMGVSVPLGYVFWALNAVPSWAMMLVVSFVSRWMM